MTWNFKEKTFLITGSGKGLGSAIAIDAGKAGANVIVHYRSSEASALEVFEQVKATGCKSILVKTDLSKPEGVEYLYKEAERAFGGVDVLINNAALQNNITFDKYTTEQMRDIFRVNLRGYILMSQKVLPYMRRRKWGRIINISSVHGKRPTNFDVGYCMTKGAIKMLGRELAIEHGGEGITVNTVELGCVDIGVKSGNPPDIFAQWELDREPLFELTGVSAWGRCLQPHDITAAVLFYASDEARYINGTALRVDDAAMLL